MTSDPLKSYRAKRDFSITSEPLPKVAGEIMDSKNAIFVVQKHYSRNLHYDLRLEVDGVLKSWAIPKRLSLDPKQKRLAIETEDHPLEYAGFEGIIPEGQYGAGTVIVWDIGIYENITEKDGRIMHISQALENGHAAILLNGKKLSGGFALTRTKRGWILVKMKDELADSSKDILKAQPESVLFTASKEISKKKMKGFSKIFFTL
ncbi:MAG: DNA ligase [Methanotrichaceae archaeon]|nr:DNA ligase [Methanotrichaceae archaeon]